MRASRQLIDALRRAADRIEDPNGGYNWIDSSRCNCGILAAELGIGCDLTHGIGLWTQTAAEQGHCSVTGEPILEVFVRLNDFGVGLNDIRELEFCSVPEVLKRAGISHLDFNRDTINDLPFLRLVARYFRAQADILEEQLTNLQQCGVEGHAGPNSTSDHPSELPGLSEPVLSEASRNQARPLLQSPPPPVREPVGCVAHMPIAGLCIYCGCAVESVPVSEREVVPTRENPLAPLMTLL